MRVRKVLYLLVGMALLVSCSKTTTPSEEELTPSEEQLFDELFQYAAEEVAREDLYLTQVRELMDDYKTVFTKLGPLLSNSDSADALWIVSMKAQLLDLSKFKDRVSRLDPPSRLQEDHALLVAGFSDLYLFSETLGPILDDETPTWSDLAAMEFLGDVLKRGTDAILRAQSGIFTKVQTDNSSVEQYAIGDVGPGGGRVYITPSTSGNTTGLYFEAAPFVADSQGSWCSNEDKLLGASGTAIGQGQSNTATADATCTSGAIQIASDYAKNGFSDWFLPSKDELNELYVNRAYLDGFSTDDSWGSRYWSSSERDDYKAWRQDLNKGAQYSISKDSTIYVRPVRSFS